MDRGINGSIIPLLLPSFFGLFWSLSCMLSNSSLVGSPFKASSEIIACGFPKAIPKKETLISLARKTNNLVLHLIFLTLTIQVHKRESEEDVEENGEPQKTTSPNPVPGARCIHTHIVQNCYTHQSRVVRCLHYNL